MKKTNLLFGALMFLSNMTFVHAQEPVEGSPILPEPAELQGDYEYYDVMSDEFNGEVSDKWLMDYMPWWSDTSKREQSGTRTRYRFLDAATSEDADNQSLQIYVNGENRMGAENFQPYYLEMLSGPQSAAAADRYLAQKNQKNNWNSKFAGFMAGGKDYLNTYRGSQSQIQYHEPYNDAGATTYGYFETRCKFLSMKGGQGLAPAFWFIGMQDESKDLGEVDGFELLDNYTLDFTIHPKGDPRISKVTKQFKFKEDMSLDYHTYGVLWDSTGFTLYVDGEKLWHHDQKIDYRMIPMFSINHHENGWIGSVDNQGLPEERTMDIDYYRVFKQKGTDPEPNKVVLPDMSEGNNIASAGYLSLFGLTGSEADVTPMQWLNDGDRTNMVMSSLDNGKQTQSTLPQMMYIDWKTPATFNTIVLHAKNAQSQAPTLVDVEVSDDGETYRTVAADIRLDWKTDSQMAESQTITLEETLKDNRFARLVIKEANMKQGRFGLCEVEIGQNITAMTPEYVALPASPDLSMKEHVFSQWNMEDNLTSNKLNTMTKTGNGISYVNGVNGDDKALMFTGNNGSAKSYLEASLKLEDGTQLKSDQDFTLGMWINPSTLEVGSDQIILFQQMGAPGGKPWLFIYQGKLGTYIDGTNRYDSQSLSANVWQYVSMTYQKTSDTAAKVSFYVHGELGETVEVKVLPDSECSPKAVLGIHKGLAKGYYNGAMDNVLLLNKAITPTDMKALYDAKGNMEDVAMKMYNASAVKPIEPIIGTAGDFSEEDIVLPEKVSVIFDNTYVKDVAVEWSQSELDAINVAVPGEYTIHGTIKLDDTANAANPGNLQATQKVIVKAVVNPAALKTMVEKVNAVVQADYTEESFAKFLTACQNTQTKETLVLIGKYPQYQVSEILPESATQDVIDRMCGELGEALNLLEKKPEAPDMTALEQVLADIEALDQSKYTEVSWNALAAVVVEAKALLQDANATSEDVTAMVDKLTTAKGALIEAEKPEAPDMTALEQVLADIEALDQSNYTEESWNALAAVVREAKALLQNTNATSEDVTAMVNKLTTAKGALIEAEKPEAPDMTALEQVLAEIEALDQSKYTEESWNALAAVVREAKALLQNTNATSEDVAAMVEKLMESKAKLVEVEVPGKPELPVLSNSDNTIQVTGDVPEGTQLSTKVLTIEKLKEMIKDQRVFSKITIEKGFDIKLLKDNAVLQPNGNVSITIALDAAMQGKKLGILYIAEDGTTQILDSIVTEEKITFETDHFSTYAIFSYQDETVQAPDTGDTTSVMPFLLLAGISGASLLLIHKRRKSRHDM